MDGAVAAQDRAERERLMHEVQKAAQLEDFLFGDLAGGDGGDEDGDATLDAMVRQARHAGAQGGHAPLPYFIDTEGGAEDEPEAAGAAAAATGGVAIAGGKGKGGKSKRRSMAADAEAVLFGGGGAATAAGGDDTGDAGASTGVAAAGGGRRRPAWDDPDDEAVEVPVAAVKRLRKLRQTEEEQSLDGKQYVQRLRQQHNKLHPRTKWASLKRGDGDSGATPDPLGLEDGSSALLRRAGGLVADDIALPRGLIELSRLRDANAEGPTEGVVRAARFHPRGRLLMAAGMDKRVRLFQIDGVKNPALESLYLEDLPVMDAQWAAGGDYIIASGRRRYFYVMDVAAGRCERVDGAAAAGPSAAAVGAHGGEMKSFESFAASGDELRPVVAFLGHEGRIPLVSLRTRQSAGCLRMPGTVRCASFSPDGGLLYTSGGDGVVHTWDLRMRACVHRGADEGCVGASSLAASPDGSMLATGASTGVVNVYNSSQLLGSGAGYPYPPSASGGSGEDFFDGSTSGNGFGKSRRPAAAAALKPVKSLLNLTTTADSLAFGPDGQVLAMASRMRRDSLRLVHTGSMTVFANWPTARSPLGHVHCCGFSPGGGLLAVGNAKGRVLLYRLHHYQDA